MGFGVPNVSFLGVKNDTFSTKIHDFRTLQLFGLGPNKRGCPAGRGFGPEMCQNRGFSGPRMVKYRGFRVPEWSNIGVFGVRDHKLVVFGVRDP